MKKINDFILEKLKLNKDFNLNNYKYHPENLDDLKELLAKLIKERGEKANLNDVDTSNITSMENLFTYIYNQIGIEFGKIHIENWDVSNVENMTNMFHSCDKFDCDLGKWDVSNVTNMSNMFAHCKNFIGKGLENWKVDNVTNFSWMFVSCENFNADLSNWNVENAIYLFEMFDHCSNFIGKCVENWNTKNCVWMNEMFKDCPKFNANLGNWDISKCKSFQYMFFGNKSFEGNGLESWNSKFKNGLLPSDFKSMFTECPNLKFNPNKSWKGKRITSQMFK